MKSYPLRLHDTWHLHGVHGRLLLCCPPSLSSLGRFLLCFVVIIIVVIFITIFVLVNPLYTETFLYGFPTPN